MTFVVDDTLTITTEKLGDPFTGAQVVVVEVVNEEVLRVKLPSAPAKSAFKVLTSDVTKT